MARKTLRVYKLTASGIEFTVLRKRVRIMVLRLKPAGPVVTAPERVSDEKICAFVSEHEEWIRRRVEEKKRVKVYLLGKGYERKDEYSLHAYAEFGDGVCRLGGVDEKAREKALMQKYEEVLAPLLPPLFEKWQKATGLYVRAIELTSARSYLGKCDVAKKRIKISCILASKIPEVIDYVVLHEICHLKVANHQKKFYDFLGRFMPDYKTRMRQRKNA